MRGHLDFVIRFFANDNPGGRNEQVPDHRRQGSKKQPAIHRGIELAKRSDASVHIVAFVHDAYITEQEETLSTSLQQQVIDARRIQLDEILQSIGCDDITIDKVEVIWAQDIASWVVNTAKPDQYSMIIKTGHRTETLIYQPSDWRILRESAVATMIVADKKWRQKNNILCAIDLGGKKKQAALNRKIIAQGKALAEILNGELYCCYAIPVPEVLVDLDVFDRKTIEKKGRKKAREAFIALADEFDLDKSALQIRVGKAEKAIPSIADKLKARLVVAGTIGRKGVRGKLIGNTAERVVHRLRTDLLAVKP